MLLPPFRIVSLYNIPVKMVIISYELGIGSISVLVISPVGIATV